jgi:hypothetical protein
MPPRPVTGIALLYGEMLPPETAFTLRFVPVVSSVCNTLQILPIAYANSGLHCVACVGPKAKQEYKVQTDWQIQISFLSSSFISVQSRETYNTAVRTHDTPPPLAPPALHEIILPVLPWKPSSRRNGTPCGKDWEGKGGIKVIGKGRRGIGTWALLWEENWNSQVLPNELPSIFLKFWR